MAAAVDTSTTPGAGAGTGAEVGAETTSTTPAGAAAAGASTTTSEAVAVTSPTTTTAPAVQTTQASTPPGAETSSSSSSPTALSESVTSILSTSASELSSSQISADLSLSTNPAAVASTTASLATTSNGLSTGAVAGIAVGCAVAGLVIGILVTFLVFKRRSKPYPKAEFVETSNEGKSFDSRNFTATPVEPPSAVSDLDQFLLAPRPDAEMAGELQSLGHLIQQHVEDHYHLFPVKQSISSLSQALTELGLDDVDNELLPGPAELADMSITPGTRHVALQHIISRVIFGSLAVKSTSKLSMLPPTVSSLVREMPPCEKHLGNPEAISHALTRWRQLSAFLLNPNRSERSSVVPDESSLVPQARDLVAALSGFLEVFVEQQNKADQESHLQAVALECAKLGYVVFSQPEELAWKFDTNGADEVVLCPGLEKVSDHQGVGCRPEVICPPEVHRV